MDKSIKSKITLAVSAIIGFALVLLVVGLVSGDGDSSSDSDSSQSGTSTQAENEVIQTSDTVSLQGVAGESPIDTLRGNTTVVGTEDPSAGFIIESINGLTADTSQGEFWLLFIDGNETGSVRAGQALDEGGQTLEWRIQNR